MENCRYLAPCCVSFGCKSAVSHSADKSRSASPLHGGESVVGKVCDIVKAENVCVLADRYVISLIDGVSVEYCGKLFACDAVVRSESSLTVAVDNSVFTCPRNRIGVVRAVGNVNEAVSVPRDIFSSAINLIVSA